MAWHEVGFIKKPHGVKGECLVVLYTGQAPWCQKPLKVLRIKTKSKETHDLKVFSLRHHHKGLIVLFENFKSPQEIEHKLKGATVYIPKDLLKSKPGETIYLLEVLHFQVLNDKKPLGQIVDFSSNGAQDLLVIEHCKKKYEIPFVEDFLDRIDFDSKKVFMKLPEGLVNNEN